MDWLIYSFSGLGVGLQPILVFRLRAEKSTLAADFPVLLLLAMSGFKNESAV